MPSAAVEAAFRTRLAANWDTADGVIFGANENSEPPSDGSPFLLIQYPTARAMRPVLHRHQFEQGEARIVLNAPTGDGLEDWLAKADTVAAVFRGDKLIFDGVEAFEPSPPIINDNNDQGNYFQLAVTVPYRYQFNIDDVVNGFTLTTASGSYSLTGLAATLTTTAMLGLAVGAGSYAVTGADSQRDLSLVVDAGPLILIGIAATLTKAP